MAMEVAAGEDAIAASEEPPTSSPAQYVYESSFTAIASSAHEPDNLATTSSVVLRTVIHDAALPSSHRDEEELEYLSLSIDADDAQEYSTVLPSLEKPSLRAPPSTQDEPPWLIKQSCPRKLIQSPLLELHQEIVVFCDLISPTPDEHNLRTKAVQRVSNVIKCIWKQCQVNVFGSFATGLYLPSSDIDMVILDSGCSDTQSGLKALAKALTKDGVAKSIQVIGKARVPIVKFVEIESKISFDVSFDLENGPEAAKFIKDALNAVPPLKPLCLVLKIFLQQRELNEVYTGGIGSYALLVMLLTYLQTHASKSIQGHLHEQSRLEQNLGVLLVEFLEFYGRFLNIRDVGISCRDGGRFFKKKERGFFDSKKPFTLTVEDPQAPTNDIAKNSFNFHKVRFAFMLAHRQLTCSDGDDMTSKAGLLARIVRVDEKLSGRRCSILSPQDNESQMGTRKRSRGRKRKPGEEHRRPEGSALKKRKPSKHQTAASKQKFKRFNAEKKNHSQRWGHR